MVISGVIAAGAVARVWTVDGEVIGGGFLVGPDLVATCAHVVADALGGDAYAEQAPTAPVRLDFPLAGAPSVRATVERWVPIRDDGTGDIALLRLTDPAPAQVRMPPLRRIERLWGHSFHVFGFPEDAWDGVWTTGAIRGKQGTGWYQLQGNPGDQTIEGGFSGAPVWDDESGAVVGMTVAADRGATTTAYLVPIEAVLGLDPELLPNPYRGLAPFGEEHAAMFFGREPDTARLVDAVGRLPVVAVAGSSGAGKSSLVRAGLIPRLRARDIAVVELTPGADVELPEPGDATVERVLVLDQFEELAAVEPLAARGLLERVVALTAADPTVRAVLTVRWAALDQLLTPELAAVIEAGTVFVASLDRSRLREAIVGPADRAPGLAFEEGLVDRILDDAGAEPGQLPLVESLLTDLWDRREGGHLTLRGYLDAGGVAGAVAQHAERVTTAIAGATLDPVAAGSATFPASTDDALRRMFTLLARPDRDGRFVRRRIRLVDLAAEQQALVPRLAEGRLLVVGSGGDGDTVELAHQALIEHWPRLQDWLTADRDFLAWREQLDAQRERWDAAGRDDGALLRGTLLAAAGEWLPDRAGDVAPADREYLRRSTQRQRRDVRRWRIVTAVLAVLVLAAGTLAVVAVQRSTALATQLAAANADTLGRESIARSPADAVVGAQLALAAWRSDPRSGQARTAMAHAALTMQSVDAVFPEVTSNPNVDMLVAGDVLLVTRPDGVTLYVGVTGPAPRRAELAGVAPYRTALSPDGHLLADVTATGDVRIHDTAAGGPPRVLATSPAAVGAPRFSSDGGRLVWFERHAPDGYDVRIVDTATGASVPHRLGVLPATAVGVALTLDPRQVLVRTGAADRPDSRLAIRSLDDGTEVAALPPGAAIGRTGAAVLTCEPGDANDPDSRPTIVVTATGNPPAAPPRRIRSLAATSCRPELSGGADTLVERITGQVGADQSLLRLTDLGTGAVTQVAGPPLLPADYAPGFSVLAALGVATAPDGRAVPLLAHGRGVLRLRAVPAPPSVAKGSGTTPIRYLAHGGGAVVRSTVDGFAVEDPATGAQVAARSIPRTSDASWLIADALWVIDRQAGTWRLDRYGLPGLERESSVALPTAADPGDHDADVDVPPDVGGAPAPLIVFTDGMLSAFDQVTGVALGSPIMLGDTPAERASQRRSAVVWARPGKPGQALTQTMKGGLQLWDIPAGRSLGVIPVAAAASKGVAFDSTGGRVAVLVGRDNPAVELWDLATFTRARPPVPAPKAQELLGFDPEGYLATASSLLDARITFLDMTAGAASGTMLPNATVAGTDAQGAMGLVQGYAGVQPYAVPLTASGWRDRLCAAADRPFTAGELAILPAGTSTDPPCS
ncbi:trypsin-like peptidase domain-containing protein [Pseudonocardia sp. GCM10023141]|uniref:nSTAND1 domain-containing NTPase n=1 Tax=Pseudonocardia sp. GCM10023141 TaxID=3252653 RepID=UPI00360C3CFF